MNDGRRWFPRRVDPEDDLKDEFHIDDAVAALEDLRFRPEPHEFGNGFDLTIVNDEDLTYGLTVTEDRSANSIYMGARMFPNIEVNDKFAKDLLVENQYLDHAKLALDRIA